MAKWLFRLNGSPYLSEGAPDALYNAQTVRAGSAHGKPTVGLYTASNPAPLATFAHNAIFGYIVEGQQIRVWRRDPTQIGTYEQEVHAGVFVEPGELGSLITWDILERHGDQGSLIGRMFADWVSEFKNCSSP